MKKIKLLIPIASLTTIPCVVAPLVGCSCGKPNPVKPVSDIDLDKTTTTVEVDATFTIKATLKYEGNANITWTQSSTDGGELTLSKTTSVIMKKLQLLVKPKVM